VVGHTGASDSASDGLR